MNRYTVITERGVIINHIEGDYIENETIGNISIVSIIKEISNEKDSLLSIPKKGICMLQTPYTSTIIREEKLIKIKNGNAGSN